MTNEIYLPAIYFKNDGTVIDNSHRLEVSNLGNVRFVEGFKNRTKEPKVFTRKDLNVKYKFVRLTFMLDNGKSSTIQVPIARLVLSTFAPFGWNKGMECDHIDRNPTNNHIDNLRWVSSAKNDQNKANTNTADGYVIKIPGGELKTFVDVSIREIAKQLAVNPNGFATGMSRSGKYREYELVEKLYNVE